MANYNTGVLLGEFDKLNDAHKYALAQADTMCDNIIIAMLASSTILGIDSIKARRKDIKSYAKLEGLDSKIKYYDYTDLNDFISNAHKLDFDIVIFPDKDQGTCLNTHAQTVKDNFIADGKTPPEEYFIDTIMDPTHPGQRLSSAKSRRRILKGMD